MHGPASAPIRGGYLKRLINATLHHKATAWCVLAAALLLTARVWVVANRAVERSAVERFNAVVELAQSRIAQRMAAHEEILRAGAGAFDGGTAPSRARWHEFVAALRLADTYPGIQGLGYVPVFAGGSERALEQAVRREGFADFVVHPQGSGPWRSAILYLEPFDWRNRRAFGYDMLTDPVRRQAMERAAASGEIAMSGAVRLTQETETDVQTGVLLYLPLYRPGMPLDSEAQRRAALRGFIFSPFRMGDLMRNILTPGLGSLRFDLYDSDAAGDSARLYSSSADGQGDSAAATARFQREVPIQVAQRQWVARFSSSPEFEAEVSSSQPLWFAAGGVAADLLMFAMLFGISRSSHLLALEKARFETAVEAVPVAMVMVDSEGWIELVNTSFEQLFGFRRDELVGRKIEMLLPEALRRGHEATLREYFVQPERRQMGSRRDLFGIHKNGRKVAIEIGLNPVTTPSGRHVIAAIADISERKQQTDALRERELRYRSVVETSPDGFWAVDRRGRIIGSNAAYSRMSGYSELELQTLSIGDLEAVEKAEETASHVDKVFAHGHDRFETMHRRKDGSVWPAEITVSSVAALGELFVFVRDLTEIKALEARRAEAEEQIRGLAFLDPLTHLPNRRLLADRLEQSIAAARRNRRHGALLFVDLDNFKDLNDSMGHESGDQLLIQVAQRLRAIVREEDTVARLGGDEFVIMLTGLDAEAVAATAEVEVIGGKILAALNQPYQLTSADYRITPSIGAALFLDDAVDDVLRRADRAMYAVKKSGKNALRFFAADSA